MRLRTRAAGLAAALAATAACATSRPLPEPAATAFVDVSVIPMYSDTVLAHQTVVVRDGRIVRMGPSARVRLPRSAERIDGRGRYLMPGLWDMHVHAIPDDGVGEENVFALLLANGVVGVRDMGAPLQHLQDVRRRIASGELLAPRLVAAGPNIVGASPWGGGTPHSMLVRAPDDARAVVDSLHRAGADFIKVHDFLGRANFTALADQARLRNLPIAGHMRPEMSPVEVARAGQRSFEHLGIELAAACAGQGSMTAGDVYRAWIAGGWPVLYEATIRLRRERDATRCGMVTGELAQLGVHVVPTLGLALRGDDWPGSPGAAYADPLATEQCNAQLESIRAVPETLRVAHRGAVMGDLADLHRAGVAVMAGSDIRVSCLVPGFSLHDELVLLTEAGLSNGDALRAATLVPARFLGLADTLGTIAPGKAADLLLLDANPLADIRATRRIAGVMARGAWMDRAALDRMLAAARPNQENR